MPGEASECQKVAIFGNLGTKVNPHTLECNIDHTVGLFGRFSLFHTCIDQKYIMLFITVTWIVMWFNGFV